MGLAAVGTSLLAPASDNQFHQMKKQDSGTSLPQKKYAIDARLTTEYYSATSMSFDYTSKDGDTVSLSMNSIEYGKSIMDVAASGNQEDMKKLIAYIKDNFEQMKKDFLKGLLQNAGQDVSANEQVTAPDPTKLLQIPDEWSAENTSQRIVEFAVSFAGIFKGKGEEFLSTIKAAIEEGFKQARDLLGDLPEEVSSLIDDTYKKTMEKLDAWAKDQENTVSEDVDTQAA